MFIAARHSHAHLCEQTSCQVPRSQRHNGFLTIEKNPLPMPLHDQLPPDALPREKLLRRGPAALSDAELLAIPLRTGLAGRSVIQLAQDVIERFGNLAGLLSADVPSLQNIKGFGPARCAEIIAIMELARRATAQQLQTRPVLSRPQLAARFVQMHIGSRSHEVFAVLLLDAQQHLIAIEELFHGTLTRASVYPREVARCALRHNAAALILAHNHPSGCVQPSESDLTLTHSLSAALALLDIRVLDHFIVSPSQTYSLHQRTIIESDHNH